MYGNHFMIEMHGTIHMGSEGGLYSSKSTNGGKGLQNSKINSYFTHPWVGANKPDLFGAITLKRIIQMT